MVEVMKVYEQSSGRASGRNSSPQYLRKEENPLKVANRCS